MRILIPAAGASSRMQGGDKLLEVVDTLPLLRRQAQMALHVCGDVVVTLRQQDAARQEVLAGLGVQIIAVVEAEEGMAASIREGVRRHAGPVMILPADMPEIDSVDLQRLIDFFNQHPTAIVRGASALGKAGHPVIFPADLMSEIGDVRGDVGARAVIERHQARVMLCPLPNAHAITDLDTPADWQKWRAQAERSTRAS